MTDRTTNALERTMAAIVDTAPGAPPLPPNPTPVPPSRKWTPILVAAGAFAIVLILVVGAALLSGNVTSREIPPDGFPGTGVTVFDPIPSEWDVLGVFDSAALGAEPMLLQRAVQQVNTVPGVTGVVVVSSDDLGVLMDLTAVESSEIGVIVSTSGNIAAAEDVALQLADGTTAALTRIVYSASAGAARVERALELLHRNAALSPNGVLTAALSGPEPRFDTDRLGREMVLEPANADALDALSQVLDMPQPGARMSGDPVYLGHIEGTHGFVVSVEEDDGTPHICDVQIVKDASGGMGCADLRDGAWIQDGQPGGRVAFGAIMPDDRSEPIAISFTALPETVSIIAIDLGEEGGRYWQRPVGGSAMFVVLAGRSNLSVTVTTFDAPGTPLLTESYSL